MPDAGYLQVPTSEPESDSPRASSEGVPCPEPKPLGCWEQHRLLFLILPMVVLTTCAESPIIPILNLVKKDFFGSNEKAALVSSFFDTGGALLVLSDPLPVLQLPSLCVTSSVSTAPK